MNKQYDVMRGKYKELERQDIEFRLMKSDKNASIKNATDIQLKKVIERLELEERTQQLITRLKRNNMSDSEKFEDIQISTETPIKDLYHYGVLGMKWGRRKASSGGTSTTPGPKSEDHKKARTLKRKKLSEMSNQEIETLSRRMQLETNYGRLTAPTKSRGRKYLDAALQTVGKKVASEFNKQFVEPRVEQMMTKILAAAARRR